MANKTSKITSIEAFKSSALTELEISGFKPDETFFILVKKISIAGLAKSGKIPNTLLIEAMSLFDKPKKGKGKETDAAEMMKNINVSDVVGLMDVVCEEAMVQPTFAEIGMYMSDTQKEEIFTELLGGVEKAKPFREE